MTENEFKLLKSLRKAIADSECSVEYGYDPAKNDELTYSIVGPGVFLELTPELFEELRSIQ